MPKLQTTAQIDCVVQTIMTVQCTSSYADYSGLLVSVDFYSKNHPWRESSLRPIRYSGGEDSRTIVLRSPYVRTKRFMVSCRTASGYEYSYSRPYSTLQ
jgi:hypothetical protein